MSGPPGFATSESPVERHSHAALLEATDRHPFVQYELAAPPGRAWWQTPGAVAFRRRSAAHGSSYTLLGDDAGVEVLIGHLPLLAGHEQRVHHRSGALSVTVPQHLEPLLQQRWRVGAGGDWEWLFTESVPTPSPGQDAVVLLDDTGRRAEVTAFLAEHSPTADAVPGGGDQWFAIETEQGALAAVAATTRTSGGAPHLASVAVDGARRGQGLGRAIVGDATRRAVEQQGVCTISLYSANAVARGLYVSLGYDNVCAWSSRAVLLSPPHHHQPRQQHPRQDQRADQQAAGAAPATPEAG